MCGRFTLTQSGAAIASAFQLEAVPTLTPRYNIAPTQPVLAVRVTPDQPTRQAHLFYWGLIPPWAKDRRLGARLINARSETVMEKPSFRNAFRQRRCLVVADGFYEWGQTPAGKQPYFFYLTAETGRRPFAFAGLWSHWTGADGSEIESCTILTTQANELLSPIHERMPVILNAADYGIWLDPTESASDRLLSLLRPFPADAMQCHPVGGRVNNPRHDDPACIDPIGRVGESSESSVTGDSER